MKLVDILARELKEWVSDWPAMGQAKDGTLHREPFLGGHTSFSLTRASDYVQAIVTRAQWQEAREALSKSANSEQPDWSEAPEGFDYFIRWPSEHMENNFYQLFGDRYVRDNGHYALVSDVARSPDIIVTKRPVAVENTWNGEGLPPVDAVCDFRPTVGENRAWSRATVKYAGKKFMIIDEGGEECSLTNGFYEFRPIRTPEQIAADEREKAIQEMVGIARKVTGFGINLADMAALYDAGYRKVNDGNQGDWK